MSSTVAVMINKDESHLAPSETFLHAHIEQLPCYVIFIIGNPGYRLLDEANDRYVPSRAFLPLALRWVCRSIGISSVASQDRRALSRFLRRREVRAVLAEYGPTAVSVMDACRDARVPLIAQFHGYDAYREQLISENAGAYRRLFQQASATIAVSKHMHSQLLKLGADPKKLFHNACGAEIPVGCRANPAQADKRFIMVGRLVEKKAPFLSIMAFSQLVARHPDARLDVIGDGPLKDACEQLCRSLGLSALVTFYGATPHSEVLNSMMQSRCFIQHSVCAPDGDREGTPVGVLEAMGMGLPVVSTRHGGIMDIIENGGTGSLVDEYDVDGMAQAMMVYAGDAALAQQIGESAREAVLANWTSEKSVERLWGIIERAIGN